MTTPANSLPVPATPPAKIRRAMPAPFQRPSISLSPPPGTPKRVWRNTLASNVKPGDTYPGIGIVESVSDELADGHRWTVTITGGAGNTVTISGTDSVWVFTAEASK